jgi:glycosyltransferase involved in cell wall biosynthesis
MANITYLFTQNRKSNYDKENIQAKEFYYGLPFIDKEKNNIEIIEFKNSETDNSKFLDFLDRFLRKYISLPFYMANVTNSKNITILKKTDHLIMVAESTGMSAFLMLFMLKKKHNIKTHLFVMGLYSKNIRYPIFKKLHFIIIKGFVNYIDNLFFLGENEFEKAKTVHKNSKKLNYFPFCIDTIFWKSTNYNLKKNNQIIFVGNDGNRNIELLLSIAKKLNDYNFIFVSQIEELQTINLDNVQLISGSWGDENITDLDLKELYLKSKICILPLKNSTQPSGQSVGLQCMSLGIPVFITKTDGFWDNMMFKNNREIVFIDNNLDDWILNIEKYYADEVFLETISLNAKKVVHEKFNLNIFNEKLNRFIDYQS